jgi:hypothetical protein
MGILITVKLSLSQSEDVTQLTVPVPRDIYHAMLTLTSLNMEDRNGCGTLLESLIVKHALNSTEPYFEIVLPIDCPILFNDRDFISTNPPIRKVIIVGLSAT